MKEHWTGVLNIREACYSPIKLSIHKLFQPRVYATILNLLLTRHPFQKARHKEAN